MNRYAEYKDSGVEWIGDIPSHWKISRLRYLHQIMFGGLWGSDPTDSENIVFVIRVSEFDYTRLKISKVTTARKLIIDSTSPKLIRKGDLILEKSGGGDRTPVGRLVMVTDEPIEPTVNSNFTNLIRTSPNKTNPRFLTYLYYVGYIVGITGRNLKQTTGIQNLDTKNLLGELVAVPPIQEQLQISQYLDKKTSQIDSLIEKIERKIELLNEQRTTLISQCVTKGLDPNAEMKDSGVEWIGNIPSHWKEKKVKHSCDVTLGKMLTPQNKGDMKKKPYLRSQNVQNGYFDLNDVKEMWFSDSELVNLELRYDDLLISEGGQVGRSALWDESIVPCYFQNSLNRIRSESVNTKFLSYLFELYFSKGYFDSVVDRVSIPHLTKEKLSEIKLVEPPLHEQALISKLLDQKTSQIDSLSKKLQQKIELLKENRQALISNIVTGKIKVIEDAP